MPIHRLACLALIALGPILPAATQDTARTGNGDDMDPAVTARNTTATGQTKPPGRAAAPEKGRDGGGRTANEKRGDAIDSGICIGCSK